MKVLRKDRSHRANPGRFRARILAHKSSRCAVISGLVKEKRVPSFLTRRSSFGRFLDFLSSKIRLACSVLIWRYGRSCSTAPAAMRLAAAHRYICLQLIARGSLRLQIWTDPPNIAFSMFGTKGETCWSPQISLYVVDPRFVSREIVKKPSASIAPAR